jgi:hypothetical protein
METILLAIPIAIGELGIMSVLIRIVGGYWPWS